MAEHGRHIQNFTLRTPRFVGKFSIWIPPSHAEGAYPQNCTVAQQKNQVSEMRFDNFLNPSTFSVLEDELQNQDMFPFWRFPTEAMLWIREVEMVESVSHHRSQLDGIDSSTLRCLMRRLLPP